MCHFAAFSVARRMVIVPRPEYQTISRYIKTNLTYLQILQNYTFSIPRGSPEFLIGSSELAG